MSGEMIDCSRGDILGLIDGALTIGQYIVRVGDLPNVITHAKFEIN